LAPLLIFGRNSKQIAFDYRVEILAGRIKRELEIRNGTHSAVYHCAVLEDELQRIWPLNATDRERKIAQFAEEHGLHLTFYWQGLCAVFEWQLYRSFVNSGNLN
jgi:hypothetical protein